MATEETDPRFADLDAWPLASAMDAMWEGQLAAVAAVQRALPAITAATLAAREGLCDGGRLIYVGAGSSGRVAVQDGAELKPTFGWPEARLRFIIAGGESAIVASVEGAEDDVADAVEQVHAARLSTHDVVIALSASGTTPFTEAALREAGARGAVTIGIASNPGTALLTSAKYPVLIETGRELIAGSTRMKAGTAQKVVLNLISTGIMLGLGCVYRGMMVDMAPTNAKLKRRAEAMVIRIAGCSEQAAARALEASAGSIKAAALLALGYDAAEAEAMLARHNGNLRHALADHANRGRGP
jgi:N-acetylmuramic acid 6-phosphate etherase